MTATLSRNAAVILAAFERLADRDNLVSLATLRAHITSPMRVELSRTGFDAALTELRRANLLCLSSADRYLTDADRAAGISEFGEVLTHVSRVQN